MKFAIDDDYYSFGFKSINIIKSSLILVDRNFKIGSSWFLRGLSGLLIKWISTVQRRTLHGILVSNFGLRSIGGMLETVANLAEMKRGDMSITFIVPLGCASSVISTNDKLASRKEKWKRKKKEKIYNALIRWLLIITTRHTYFVSTLDKCMIRDFPLPHGSIR